MRLLGQHRRGKRHEFGPAQLMIQPLIDVRIPGVIENRAVSQGSRAVFHPTRKSSYDVILSKHFGHSVLDILTALRCDAFLL